MKNPFACEQAKLLRLEASSRHRWIPQANPAIAVEFGSATHIPRKSIQHLIRNALLDKQNPVTGFGLVRASLSKPRTVVFANLEVLTMTSEQGCWDSISTQRNETPLSLLIKTSTG